MTGPADTPPIEVTVAAPVDDVWRALRDPALVRRWHGWEYDDDGGGLDTEVRTIFVDGVTEDAAAHVLVFSGGDRFSLHPVPGGTVVRITRPPRGVNPEWDAYYDDITLGWTAFLLQLRFGLERHGLAERRTHYFDGRLRTTGTLVAALGLAEAAELPLGTRYQAVSPTGDMLCGEVFARVGHVHTFTVDALGDGLLVLAETPSVPPGRPHGGALAILTAYGLAEDDFAEVQRRWIAWWESARVPDEQSSQQPAS